MWHGDDLVVKGNCSIHLPALADHPHGKLLDALHRELLVHIVGAAPVPHLLVYPRPWYRDAAMVAMCLARTDNLHLIEPWIMRLSEPFDGNNGCDEPDNLGQVLYLISLVADAAHPMVATVVEAAKRFTSDHLMHGPTDGGPAAAYQTAWMKLGLHRLGLEDTYRWPEAPCKYVDLCWWADQRPYDIAAPMQSSKPRYPYLDWARANYFNGPPPIDLLGTSPHALTWEAHASKADYLKLDAFDPAAVAARICMPHTWHAAEAFCYYIDRTA